MKRFGIAVALATLATALPVMAQEKDCKTGEVTFETAGTTQTLNLILHERKLEVPKGLMNIAELPAMGGVFSVYPEPRGNRTLVNSDVLPADLMTFDANGKALSLMEDQTGVAVDSMESGEGMLYATYLAGGTIAATGFDVTTVMTGWRCVDE